MTPLTIAVVGVGRGAPGPVLAPRVGTGLGAPWPDMVEGSPHQQRDNIDDWVWRMDEKRAKRYKCKSGIRDEFLMIGMVRKGE